MEIWVQFVQDIGSGKLSETFRYSEVGDTYIFPCNVTFKQIIQKVYSNPTILGYPEGTVVPEDDIVIIEINQNIQEVPCSGNQETETTSNACSVISALENYQRHLDIPKLGVDIDSPSITRRWLASEKIGDFSY